MNRGQVVVVDCVEVSKGEKAKAFVYAGNTMIVSDYGEAERLAVAKALIVGGITATLQDEKLRELVKAFQSIAGRTGTLVIDADTVYLLEEHQRKLANRFDLDLVNLATYLKEQPQLESKKKKMPFYHHKRRF